MNTLDQIKQQIAENPILLYMKGSPQFPQCGFSARSVELVQDAIRACGEQFSGDELATVDVLSNPDIRQTLPGYANWPTFPQLYVNGELIGGCDIIVELAQRDELSAILKEVLSAQTT